MRAVELENFGTAAKPFGYVYFDDKTRCAFDWEKGAWKATGGWPKITAVHVRVANDYLNLYYGPLWRTGQAVPEVVS